MFGRLPVALPNVSNQQLLQPYDMPADLSEVMQSALGVNENDSYSSDGDDNYLPISDDSKVQKLIELSNRLGWLTTSQVKQQSRLFKEDSPSQPNSQTEATKTATLCYS